MIRPPLTVIDPSSNLPAPPRKLGAHGLDLWRSIMAEYHIADPGGRELLAEACAGLDRAEALGERIAEDGEVIVVRGTPRTHPALRGELSARSFVCRSLQRLGLNLEAVKPIGRPSGRRDAD